MSSQSKEQMIMSLEKRLAVVEAALKIIPAPETVINPRFGNEAATPQQEETTP